MEYKIVKLSLSERNKKRIDITNGLLYDADGNLYDTKQSKTIFSGPGAAVFVINAGGLMYASSHGIGVDGRINKEFFTHASFLGGAPVLAAGEIGVSNGHLKWFSRKSGHYLPRLKELFYFLKWLEEQGVILKGVACRVDISIGHFGFPGPDPYYDAQKVLETIENKLKNLSEADARLFLHGQTTTNLGLSISDVIIPQVIN